MLGRREAITRTFQVNDAPFVVEIEETPKANHLFLMHMKSRIQKFRDQPSLLTLFVRRLITYVGGKSEDVLIDSLETDEGPDSSILVEISLELPRNVNLSEVEQPLI